MTEGDPVLRRRAQEVEEKMFGSEELATLAEDMAETMAAAKGVGIAAPQVGVGLRVFIADTADGPLALVNPVITKMSSKKDLDEEGCLSVPGKFGTVGRARSLSIQARSVAGEKIAFEAKGFFARILQHENDHLDGILFIDRLAEAEGGKKA